MIRVRLCRVMNKGVDVQASHLAGLFLRCYNRDSVGNDVHPTSCCGGHRGREKQGEAYER